MCKIKGMFRGFFFPFSRLRSHLGSQSSAAGQICYSAFRRKLPWEYQLLLDVQADGALQAELSELWVKNRILPSTELEAGQKSDQTAIGPCCCSGWAVVVFSQPPVCHVPSPLEAGWGGRDAAEHLSAAVVAPGLGPGLVPWILSRRRLLLI